MGFKTKSVCFAACAALCGEDARAQASDSSSVPADASTVRVAASQRYNKGRVHEFLMGGGYRDLWKAEMNLPVLSLKEEGGGLAPVGRFGGLQSAVLAFKGKNGKSYSFRGTDKDPSAVLPAVLKDTFARSLIQDQMAAQHPGGALTAGVLSKAAGVLTIEERLVVMPDSPLLGQYREEFAGMVGTFFEYPQPAQGDRPGFHGATEIISQKKLYRRLKTSNEDPVWREAFLRARLIDILLGDFDRHRKQWRWAKIPGESRWQPLPEDRDQAFVRYDGFGRRLAHIYIPILQCYSATYPSIPGLTLHGWEQDRWLLASLEWSTWQTVVKDIQQRLSDDVVAAAIAQQPKVYAEIDGARLGHDIKGRRDTLLQGAREFYEHLAREVDVQTSSAADNVLITWQDETMRVQVRDQNASNAEGPWFDRRFLAKETKDVRIYLRGGDDHVTVQGSGPINLRLIAPGGKKTIDDRKGEGAILYDAKGVSTVQDGSGTTINHEVYEKPSANSGFVDVEDVPPRDWGDELIPFPSIGYEPDYGVILGLSALHTVYGFRKHPWAARYKVGGAVALEVAEPVITFGAELRPENSKWLFGLDAQYSGVEAIRFYGFGNETERNRRDAFYRVRNQQTRAELRVERNFFDNMFRPSAGIWTLYSDTTRGDRLIDQLAPFGYEDFSAAGATLNLVLDTRGTIEKDGELALPIHVNPAAGYPTRGFLVEGRLKLAPPILSSRNLWGSVWGAVSGYMGFFDRGRLTIALRVAGEYTFGDVPYFEAAYLGGGGTFSGPTTLRGLRAQRYVGDASLYGNIDVRLFLGHVFWGLPMDVGLFGMGDVGRVFVDGEDSDVWHPTVGGGVWFAPLARTNTFSFAVAGGREAVVFYGRAGFHF